MLDVVYNHFGPEGNYLHLYAPQFFTERHHTPWGAAMNFDSAGSRTVREFFIHNALYWLEEFHFDGLRFDAVHAIPDESRPDMLSELAERVRHGPGASRHVHLVLENDLNQAARLLRSGDRGAPRYDAQWNDDFHHAGHVVLTGETDGYYADYAPAPLPLLGRCLAEGFAYQGEPSPFRKGGQRGEPSALLPPEAFVCFLQNHDQVGNRAFGERLTRLAAPAALRAALAVMLLAPSPPLLFMGEEFGAASPFLFFCDFNPELARAVSEGRRREFSAFARFRDSELIAAIPDPGAPETFARSRLDWSSLEREPHARWLAFYRELLALRHAHILPLLANGGGRRAADYRVVDGHGLAVDWRFVAERTLALRANLGPRPLPFSALPPARGGITLYATPQHGAEPHTQATLAAWSVTWTLIAATPEAQRTPGAQDG
jgi:malto-oligosyltrehalose trehalohydrolase